LWGWNLQNHTSILAQRPQEGDTVERKGQAEASWSKGSRHFQKQTTKNNKSCCVGVAAPDVRGNGGKTVGRHKNSFADRTNIKEALGGN